MRTLFWISGASEKSSLVNLQEYGDKEIGHYELSFSGVEDVINHCFRKDFLI